ncbi:MAG: L,D-transpeptidase family protein [Polyangiaceae bacterium]
MLRPLHITSALVLALASCAPGHDAPRDERPSPAETTTAAANEASTAPLPSASASAATNPVAAGSANSATPAPPQREALPDLELARRPDPLPGDRIYAKGRWVWIQPAPGGSGWIGYITLGESLRLYEGSREKAKTIGPGCDAWYRVEPMGYVCDGPEATLDPDDPVLAVLATHRGDADSPYPFHYGESIGTPRYDELPDAAKQRRSEWDLEVHRERLAAFFGPEKTTHKKAIDDLYRGIDLSPAGVVFPELPRLNAYVREARAFVQIGSTVAWSKDYDDPAGRTWLYTSDHALVPKDRVKVYPPISFHGVKLGGPVELPLAFFRKKDRPRWRITDGKAEQASPDFARLSWVGLTGKKQTVAGVVYLETREAGIWVRESDAAVAEQRGEPPFQKDEVIAGRKTWVDISILGGTLVAYEDKTPVFATLISPGRGGLPVPGRNLVSTASTPVGTFRVDGKFRWASMVSSTDANLVHSEVPYVLNFHGPHALHGAYWHDQWGELKSGGCVNLSPVDSKWIFDWSEPALPPEWHGMRSVPDLGPATRVIVRP